MAKYPNITLTNAGLSMIAESQGSGQLIFTAIKLGDGSLVAGEDIKALAAVKNPLLTANISNIDTATAGQTTLTAVISNAAVTSGFFAREMGIYAKVGTDGVEKLYAYTNAGNYADYMPDKTAQINENQIKITLIVGNAANVTAVIDGSIVYPTKETMTVSIAAAVKTHDEKATTHAQAFAAHNADPDAHNRNFIKKSGDTMTGQLIAGGGVTSNSYTFQTQGNTGLYAVDGDVGNPIKDQKANLKISSWYSTGFYDGCSGKGYTAGIDHRTGDFRTKGTVDADNEVFARNGWFRSCGDTGWYNEKHGGGWYMSDDTWIRAVGDKSIHTNGVMEAGGGSEG